MKDYKRFTTYNEKYNCYVIDNNKLQNGDDVCYMDTNESIFVGGAIDKLAELEDKIENGTLIELLPCKIGDIVYQTEGARIYELMILDILIHNYKPYYETDTIDFDERAFGVSIFLTEAEAEAKLRELQGAER